MVILSEQRARSPDERIIRELVQTNLTIDKPFKSSFNHTLNVKYQLYNNMHFRKKLCFFDMTNPNN